MTFASRQDAGIRLGRFLRQEAVEVDIVLGLPRGGVVVAAEVAHVLQRPLDTLIVRKIGHPLNREFAIGALAENGVVVLEQKQINPSPVARDKFDAIIREEAERLWQYQLKFHQEGKRDLTGKAVLLVDDGLATGSTTEAAILSARKQRAESVIVAAPVASTFAVERLESLAEVIVLFADPGFNAVGRYYESFPQTTDQEVLDLLKSVVSGQ